MCVCSAAQSCLTLCDPMDSSLPGSSVRGIFQARILGWVIISYSRWFSQSRDWTHISWVYCIGRWILYHWATWKYIYSRAQGSNPRRLHLLHCQVGSLPLCHLGSPTLLGYYESNEIMHFGTKPMLRDVPHTPLALGQSGPPASPPTHHYPSTLILVNTGPIAP